MNKIKWVFLSVSRALGPNKPYGPQPASIVPPISSLSRAVSPSAGGGGCSLVAYFVHGWDMGRALDARPWTALHPALRTP